MVSILANCPVPGNFPCLVSLERLFLSALFGFWLSLSCQSKVTGWPLSLISFHCCPSQHPWISIPSWSLFFCEPSFSSATGPSAEDLVLAGNCPQFSAFWFPIRIPSLRHSDTHFCWNCIIFLLSPIFLPDSFPQHSHSNLGYRSLPVASLSTATLTWAVLSSHPRPLQKLPLAIVLGALWS